MSTWIAISSTRPIPGHQYLVQIEFQVPASCSLRDIRWSRKTASSLMRELPHDGYASTVWFGPSSSSSTSAVVRFSFWTVSWTPIKARLRAPEGASFRTTMRPYPSHLSRVRPSMDIGTSSGLGVDVGARLNSRGRGFRWTSKAGWFRE